MPNATIRGYVDRIETLLTEIATLREDVRGIYEEAAASGINAKALRKLIAKRRKKPDPETEAVVAQYELDLAAPAKPSRAAKEDGLDIPEALRRTA